MSSRLWYFTRAPARPNSRRPMHRQSRTVIKGGPALRALACCILLAQSWAAAAEVSIYEAVVPLAGSTAADRNAGFGDALRSAAVRASGRSDAGSNPVVAAAAADPSRYVQQYSTTADRMLKVGFNARAMDALMQRAQLPFWPVERPVTVVLLVVPSVAGGQRAVLASDRVPERAEVERAAVARGLPITWPQSTVDAQQVRAQLDSGPGRGRAGRVGRQGPARPVSVPADPSTGFSPRAVAPRAGTAACRTGSTLRPIPSPRVTHRRRAAASRRSLSASAESRTCGLTPGSSTTWRL